MVGIGGVIGCPTPRACFEGDRGPLGSELGVHQLGTLPSKIDCAWKASSPCHTVPFQPGEVGSPPFWHRSPLSGLSQQ